MSPFRPNNFQTWIQLLIILVVAALVARNGIHFSRELGGGWQSYARVFGSWALAIGWLFLIAYGWIHSFHKIEKVLLVLLLLPGLHAGCTAKPVKYHLLILAPAALFYGGVIAYRFGRYRFKEDAITELAAQGKLKEVEEEVNKHPWLINIRGKAQMTALMNAVENGHAEVVKFLLDKGADFKMLFIYETVLHIAARKGHAEIAAMLIEKGAELNARDGLGRTPLYQAADREHPEMVRLLLAKGADKSIKDNFEKSPLDAARFRKNQEICELLK